MMNERWLMALALGLALVLSMAGCGGGEDPAAAPGVADFQADRQALANRQRGPKPPAAKPAPPAPPVEGGTGYVASGNDYFYDARGKRDPFRTFRFDDDDVEQEDFGPLGDFELGQLELSAVIWDATNPRALILDPGGRSYIIREGSAIGKNNGQVIHIGDNLVLVKETYENFAGEQTTKDVELRIRLSQGG